MNHRLATMTASIKTTSYRHPFATLLGWLALTYSFAALGAFGSVHAAGFYAQLLRPSWAPPAWLFGPVWSVLYTLMAFSAWRACRPSSESRTAAVFSFLLQLVFNSLWSWLFFAWQLGSSATACILALLISIVANILLFARRDRLGALLLLPYLAWVSFAAALCFRIWQLNPGQLG